LLLALYKVVQNCTKLYSCLAQGIIKIRHPALTKVNIGSLVVAYYIDVATSENIGSNEKHNTLCKKHTIVFKKKC
jgi:hypothetical protein